MSEQPDINQTIKGTEYAATSATGDAIITITNYYYREDTKVVTVEPTDTDDENLPCPYRGLFHFGPDDAEFFFGRGVFVEELFQATQTRNFIPVLGASGSGKSSVVLAGLVPKLQQEGHWKFTHFRPGVVRKKELRSIVDPFYALATALVPLYTPHLDKTKQLAQASDLADLLRDGKILLSDVIAAIQQNYPNHRVLLIADQFEELYTICHEENIRRHFLDILIDNIYSPIFQSQSPLVLVLAMRADFLGNALSYRPFADVLRNADIKLGPMNRQELSQVIEKPAEKLGAKFEAGLVERILDDVEDEPGNLPLVEFALTLLWQRRTGKQLNHAAYEAIGRVDGALANYADDKYNRLMQMEQEQTRRILIQLVRPGEGTEDTRRLATKEELGEKNWFLVQHLADARLVVTTQNASGQETAEVVHEALIQNWVKLRQWMETDRDFRAWQERLRTALRQWEETKRDEGALLRGVPLAAAEEWLRKRPVDLSLTEQEYIRRSAELRESLLQEEEERRQRELEAARKIAEESEARRTAEEKARQEAEQRAEQQANANKQLRRGAVALGTSLLIAIGAGTIAWSNQQKALQRELTARQNFYTSSLNLASQNFDKAQIIQFVDLLDNLKPQTNQKDLRGFEWYYLWKQAHSDKLTIQHDQAVTSVAVSPDGKTLATINSNGRTMSSKNSVKLWDMATGKELATFPGHKDGTISLAFSPDGKLLATGGLNDGSVKLWDVETGKEIHSYRASTGYEGGIGGKYVTVHSVKFSPDGKTIALFMEPLNCATDETRACTLVGLSLKVRLLDVTTGKEIGNLNFGNVRDMAFSPDKKTFATSYNSDTVKLWDLTNGKELNTLKLDNGWAESIAFSPDGKKLAMGGDEVRIWDVINKGTPRRVGKHKEYVVSVEFSPDGKTLATTGKDRTVKIWDTVAYQELTTIRGHSSSIRSIAFSPDSKTLVTGSEDKTAKLWDVEQFLKQSDTVGDSFAFSPNGKTLVTWDGGWGWRVVGSENNVMLLDVGNFKEFASLNQTDIDSALFSPESKLLITQDAGGVQLWDVNTAQELTNRLQWRKEDNIEQIQSVSLAPDGKTLAVGGDKKVNLWNIDKWQKLPPLKGDEGYFTSMAFSPDSKILATVDGKGIIQLWKTTSWQKQTTFKTNEENINYIEFSFNGEILITRGLKGIKLLNASTGKEEFAIKSKERYTSWAFSPNGKLLALATDDNRVKLWDVAKAQAITTFEGHTDIVFSIAFSPDSKTLATGSADETVKLWNIATAQELLTLEAKLGSVRSVGFSPDGKTLVTGHWKDDGRKIKFWRAATDEEIWTQSLRASNPILFQEGKELAKKGNVKDAVAQFKKILGSGSNLDLDPEVVAKHLAVQGLFEDGRTLAQKGNLKDAVAKFQAALKLAPSLNINAETEAKRSFMLAHRPLIAEGENHIKQGFDYRSDRKRALLELTRGIELIAPSVAQGYPPPPMLLEAYLSRGFIYFVQQGEYQKAITDWQAATKIKPDDARAYNNLGFANYELNQLDKAITDWQTAVKVNPQESESWAGLGIALYDKGQTQEAIAAYQKALKIESQFSSPAWLRDSQSWSEKSARSAAKLLQVMPKTSKN